MTKSFVWPIAICAAAFCLAVQPARGQGTSNAGVPGAVGPTIELSAEKVLKNNPQLNVKLEPLLGGMAPEEAVKGYKAIGDFITAAHASHDLGVPFPQFKCAELGGKFCSPETSAKPIKIEGAILVLKPDAGKDGAKKAANDAKHEAKPDLNGVNLY